MFFLPYGTDTPIYHWPIATGILILLNLIGYPLFLDQIDTFGLSHGEGLQPIQWITSFFVHGNLFHLLGNLLFLWVFGLVVEGKLGSLGFAALYLGVGCVQNIIEQVLYLGSPDVPSLGASSAIYGMMMCSMLFAPKDNLLCFALFFFRVFLFPVPILIFAIVYFLWDFSVAFLIDEFQLGTALLHVMGGGVGLAAGAALLKLGWVDGEQQDLFSLLQEAFTGQAVVRKPSQREQAQRELDREEAARENAERIAVAWKSIDTHIAAGNVDAAIGVFTLLHRRDPTARWDEARLLHVIRHLIDRQDWPRTVEMSEAYLAQFQDRATTIRIHLARILLRENHAPRRAIKTLQPLDVSQLTDGQKKICRQIIAEAKRQIADGAIELEDE